MRRWFFFLGAPLFLGCANRGLVRFEALGKRASSQDFAAAIEQIKTKRSDLYNSQSELLYAMDLGALYHYAGQFDSSIAYLEKAVKIHDDLYAHSVTNEAVSFLTNDNIRPYRGRPYEIAWVHLFLAFDYLGLQHPDDARVEVRQAQLFLDEERRKAGSDKNAYRDDGLFRTVSSLIYEGLGEKDDALISLYQAVKAYRDAGQPVPPELARYAGATLAANGRADDVKELDLNASAATPGDPVFGGSEIVVVGELGRSPTVGETEFWGTWVRDGVLVFHYNDPSGKTITEALPAPGLPETQNGKPSRSRRNHTQSGTTVHVEWAMPTLQEVPSRSNLLKVSVSSSNKSGEPYADTRRLLQQDLDATRTTTLTRTVIRVVIRTIAEQETKSKLNTGNPLVNLLLNIGTDALGDQLEQADVRAWFLLPRSMQLARFPVSPGHYTLTLGAEGEGQVLRTETREVEVKSGEKTFVFFNSLK